jgi:hypothetical protein
MLIAIFFGGVAMGFLMGCIIMALLASATHQEQREKINAAQAYQHIMLGPPFGK